MPVLIKFARPGFAAARDSPVLRCEQAFARTEQLELGDKFHNAVRLGTSPIVRALFDFDGGMDMVRDLDDITFTEWFTQLGGSR